VTVPHDIALIDRLSALHPAVVSDCLDLLGHRHQVMAPGIRPLAIGMRLAGVAATVRVVADDGIPADRSQWHRGTIAAVDALQPGDVLVASHCDAAFWGELLATAAGLRGARGVVADAYVRDTLALIDMDFATFARGINCADALGRIRVEAAGVPIECGGVQVHPGDFVLGDHDGVVVLPAAVATEAIGLAEQKMAGEDRVRDELARGMSLAEAFGTFGVL
jgi:4-hydroxy-4-methyl-2-oxoglutarate aldolase